MSMTLQRHFMLQQPCDKNLFVVSHPKGMSTLLAVLLVTVVGSALVVSLLLLSVGFSKNILVLEPSAQARALATACSETALLQIRNNISFTGSATSTFFSGNCTYTVTNTGSQNRTITAEGNVRNVSRKVKVLLERINPTIRITYWQEVADF